MAGRRDEPDEGDLFGAPAPRQDEAVRGAAPEAAPRRGRPPARTQPLADRLRPAALDEVVGQDHLLGPDGALRRMLERGSLASLILWGGPGVGKTTIARLLADAAGLRFVQLSAVFSGVADLKRAFDDARRLAEAGRGTLLFVDEIHRFNRAQQDGFLPVVEDGTVILVGATTENPSFALNGALLSRCQVLVLRRLDDEAQERLLRRAEAECGHELPLTAEGRATLRAMADGDGRYLLNMVEQVLAVKAERPLDAQGLSGLLARRAMLYDKDREEHYNLISALHKSLRGSDPDAALYWFARMLDGGEDPRYIARRLTRFAAEDVGMADPQALPLAIAAWETYERLGSPEGELALAQLVVHLGTAPKSNAVYAAYKAARRVAKSTGSLMPPAHILNAPTGLMKDLGYGRGYADDYADIYADAHPDAGQRGALRGFFPDGMARQQFYQPFDRGFEREIGKRLEHWARLRERGREQGREQKKDA
ncbi:replication-associated recombination protein A [Nguyenibacter sp. L1]|uniref:replication-associated recombination protein A n=1 Tax=Nguyenibacter sp. L1 TaxID=3049350 RepID=UPI002B470FF9|nr:replication-associated recombination protein A [Nguyenibacter sp. L1]WRH88510.1 replication-associated recombination protein A [Nguyenibacter sp. L1]